MPHYIMHSWHHLMPHPKRQENLETIAQLIQPFDVVALQEVDAGSFRSGYVDQIDFLAKAAGFSYFQTQTTRNLGRLAQHSKGLLSRYPIHRMHHYILPSRVPGRGLTTFCLGEADRPIFIVNAHLSLGQRANHKQLDFIAEIMLRHEHVIIMGDLNIQPEVLLAHAFIKEFRLSLANLNMLTYPSWQPRKQLDYILVTPDIKVLRTGSIPCTYSDHLPVYVEIAVPKNVNLGLVSPKVEE